MGRTVWISFVSTAVLISLISRLGEATTGSTYSHAARVLELSDRFLDIRKDGIWLVKFYAPWCQHCKKLEPVFGHVAQSLYDTEIRVGRIDCTRYPSLANEFKVNGYPTIMFMKGDTVHTYRGEPVRDEIVKYAKLMIRPPVNELGDESLQSIFEQEDVLFGYVGKREGDLWEAFNKSAHIYQPYCSFYALGESQVPKELIADKTLPLIFVHKEGQEDFYDYNPNELHLDEEDEWATPINETTLVNRWVARERFPTFLKITRSNFQSLLNTEKYLVMAILEEDKRGRITEQMAEFKNMLHGVIMQDQRKYKGLFQFGWVGSPELANSIAMYQLPLPSLMIINATTFHHHIPDDDPLQLTHEAIVTFLDQVVEGAVPVYGGNSFFMRALRSIHDGKNSLVDMWIGNPILTTLLFGLPLGFLGLIFYSICCADMLDATEEEEQGEGDGEVEEDENHEKKE